MVGTSAAYLTAALWEAHGLRFTWGADQVAGGACVALRSGVSGVTQNAEGTFSERVLLAKCLKTLQASRVYVGRLWEEIGWGKPFD